MTALISVEDSEVVIGRSTQALQSSRPVWVLRSSKGVSLLLEAFSSSFTSLRSDTHEFLRDVKEVPIYMQHNASRTKRCRRRQAPDSELGCPVMLRVSSKEVVQIVIAKTLSWEKSGLPSLVTGTCVVSSLFSSWCFLKSSKCPLFGEIRHWKAELREDHPCIITSQASQLLAPGADSWSSSLLVWTDILVISCKVNATIYKPRLSPPPQGDWQSGEREELRSFPHRASNATFWK